MIRSNLPIEFHRILSQEFHRILSPYLKNLNFEPKVISALSDTLRSQSFLWYPKEMF